MHAVAPAAKIVFLLRHPVSRFWSQCKMKYSYSTLEPGDPAAMRLLDSPNGRPRGEYTQTMLRFARRYDPGRMLLVFHDAIAQQPVQVLQRIFSFLGVEDQPPDEALAVRRVNHAADDRTIPESLRGRVEAAYRSEMETLAEVFGGYAAGWLDGTRPDDAAAVVPLSAAHIDAIERRPARVRSSRTKPPCRVFCISMQRSGTTSVGDWLESHGLVRAGSPTSVRLGWTRLWMRGEHEAIFSSAEFQKAEVLEDDPWWCPDYYRFLAMRFPDARFILLTRDPDEWFTSLCHHSGGQNPGWSDIHARIYDREADLRALVAGRTDIDPTQQGLLSIVDHGPHYKAAYQRHAEAARTFFAGMPGRLFTGRLEDPQTFIDLCEFAGVMHNPAIAVPRSNARTEEMSRRLAAHRARMNR